MKRKRPFALATPTRGERILVPTSAPHPRCGVCGDKIIWVDGRDTFCYRVWFSDGSTQLLHELCVSDFENGSSEYPGRPGYGPVPGLEVP